MYINHNSQTMRGTVKRKLAEVDEYPCYPSSSSSSSSSPSSLSSPASSEWESDGENVSSETPDFRPHSPSSPNTLPSRSILKRHEHTGARCSVRFHQVTVFSFPRCQGFTSVPGRGGATLGMARKHSALQRYTVADHALEQQRRRRERRRERAREERLEAFKKKLVTSGTVGQREADMLTVDQVPDEDAPGVHVSDAEADNRGFLQPFSSKQRQALLQAAGVKHIDRDEKRQLHALRLSREACGCDCQGFCEPETCACSLAGIKCQVDRSNFPCGCSKDSCGNTQGRIQFDSRRVRTHYIHTLMRLELQTTLHDEARTPESPSEPPGELQEYEDPPEQDAPDSCCPFGFALEEDGLPLTMPPAPSFHFIPECLVEEESSCGSDMTEFSSSSDSDTGRYISETLLEVDGGPTRERTLCDCKKNKYSSSCGHRRHTGDSSSSADTMGPRTDDLFADGTGRTSVTGYLEENANQARDIFEDDSLQDFPSTPSPTLDYSFGAYMDLSLSSGSDLEFFDSDYPSGPMHSSFKGHRHTDSFQHLQLFSAFSRPSYESSTQLLESLIGLTEPSTEQIYSVAGTQLL